VTTKLVLPTKQRLKALQEVGKVVMPTEGQEDEERANLDLKGVCSDVRCVFLTILENILTVGESAGGEEQAAWPTFT
jgi:hypothetical protein